MARGKFDRKRRAERARAHAAKVREEPEVAKKYKKPAFTDKVTMPKDMRLRPGSKDAARIRSGVKAMPPMTQRMPERYTGEMAEREAAAQKEISRKKTMVAPMYNKGGLQYVGDLPPEIVRDLGKKV